MTTTIKHLPSALAIAGALLLASTGVAAQTPKAAGGERAASEPMTNKAAQPQNAIASGATAEKKPAKPGAQSGPTPTTK